MHVTPTVLQFNDFPSFLYSCKHRSACLVFLFLVKCPCATVFVQSSPRQHSLGEGGRQAEGDGEETRREQAEYHDGFPPETVSDVSPRVRRDDGADCRRTRQPTSVVAWLAGWRLAVRRGWQCTAAAE